MDFQEVDSPSTAREKVDIAQPIRDKEESSKWNHRKSLAWDSAFLTTPGVLDHEELFGSLKLGENEIDVNHKDSIKTLPTEIAARPSFAWDNAFFTEPGVLDAEELSLVNDGFTSNNTQPRNSDDSMATTTTQEGSRFSVSSIELDLFNHLRRASLCNTSEVKQTGAQDQIQRKLPDGKKRTKWYKLRGSQPLSLIPQPKVYPPSSSTSSSIPKFLTPRQAKSEKKIVASELGRKKGKNKDNGFEENSGSESIIRSSYSGYTVKDLTSSSSSSGLRLPLPKMGFFDSEENDEKENRNPNGANRSTRRHKSPLETMYSPPDNRSVLGQRKKRK